MYFWFDLHNNSYILVTTEKYRPLLMAEHVNVTLSDNICSYVNVHITHACNGFLRDIAIQEICITKHVACVSRL
jgi:hypothetical protein